MSEEVQQLQATGFLRIPGAFSRDDASAMADRVWRSLEGRFGVDKNDPATWDVPFASGLQGMKQDRVFDPIGGPVLTTVLDSIFGEGGWARPKDWGQMLVTFPNADSWTVPHRLWHTDFPYTLPPDQVVGALVFTFISDVPEGSGGTAIVQGSPSVVRNFLADIPRKKLAATKMKFIRRSLMRSDPWLAELGTSEPGPDRSSQFLESESLVGDVPVRVVELHGKAGDIVLGHPWLLHCTSGNAGSQPRLMRVQRIRAQRRP